MQPSTTYRVAATGRRERFLSFLLGHRMTKSKCASGNQGMAWLRRPDNIDPLELIRDALAEEAARTRVAPDETA